MAYKPTAQETYGWFNRPPYESTREPYQEVVVKFRDFSDNDAGKGIYNVYLFHRDEETS